MPGWWSHWMQVAQTSLNTEYIWLYISQVIQWKLTHTWMRNRKLTLRGLGVSLFLTVSFQVLQPLVTRTITVRVNRTAGFKKLITWLMLQNLQYEIKTIPQHQSEIGNYDLQRVWNTTKTIFVTLRLCLQPALNPTQVSYATEEAIRRWKCGAGSALKWPF